METQGVSLGQKELDRILLLNSICIYDYSIEFKNFLPMFAAKPEALLGANAPNTSAPKMNESKALLCSTFNLPADKVSID